MAPKPRKLPVYTPDFEQFWRAYPRRRPNPRPEACVEWHLALQALATLTPPLGAEHLIAAAERFAEECRRENVDAVFIPHARTWLHRHRFMDYLEDHRAEGRGQKAEKAPCAAASARRPADPRLQPLAAEIGRTLFDTWLAPLEIVEHPNGLIRIIAPDPAHRDWVRNHYGDALRRTLGRAPEYAVRSYHRIIKS